MEDKQQQEQQQQQQQQKQEQQKQKTPPTDTTTTTTPTATTAITKRYTRSASSSSPPTAAMLQESASSQEGGSPRTTSKKRPATNSQQNLSSLSLLDQRSLLNNIAKALKKDISERNDQERLLLEECSFLIPEVEARKQKNELLKQRSIEQEEPQESIEKKATILAHLIKTSKSIIVYTGAGISTSACIPDYRGPNGLWTQLKKTGTFSITKILNLAAAEPTYTHMAIRELCRREIIGHVVSQNCDGLHLRSGLPHTNLSEIHGNMYIEVCTNCNRLYYRLADVTEKTSRFHHKTGRKCIDCKEPNNNLIDTIVLYGERSKLSWPMNWTTATKAARKADLIICLGSSLKTLRRYESLWPKKADRSSSQDTKLVIVNLQYTSKDKNACLKINGKCDDVMKLVMQRLNIKVQTYDWSKDPLIRLSTPFTDEEKSNLKRVLLFRDQQIRGETKPALKESPNLISEISDDPETKHVKMRIRINTHPNLVCKTDQTDDKSSNIDLNSAIPGWLGKSLTSAKNPSSKRKRHGNRGKKRCVKKVELETKSPEAAQENPCSTSLPIVENMLLLPNDDTIIKTESCS